jgi:hypothetical protein
VNTNPDGYRYLKAEAEGNNLKRKPYGIEQKKWADWNKAILKKWPGEWFRIYENVQGENSEWDWFFEAAQDHLNFTHGYEYDIRYPTETHREHKEIWARKNRNVLNFWRA